MFRWDKLHRSSVIYGAQFQASLLPDENNFDIGKKQLTETK